MPGDKKGSGFLEGFTSSKEPGLRDFALFLRGAIRMFDCLAKVARQRGKEGLEKELGSMDPPSIFSGIYGGEKEEKDRMFYCLWGILFPGRFEYNLDPAEGPGSVFVLREGESIGERERDIVLCLLMSPAGRSLLFKSVVEGFGMRYASEPPDSPQKVLDTIGELTGKMSDCGFCGELFPPKRKGQKYCDEPCRKKAHEVPSSGRKDQTPRAYFVRKINERYSRRDAWDQTRKQHGAVLKELGKDGPEPPKSWAKEKKEGRG